MIKFNNKIGLSKTLRYVYVGRFTNFGWRYQNKSCTVGSITKIIYNSGLTGSLLEGRLA